MTKSYPWRLLLGAGLILMGVLALLDTLNLVKVADWWIGALFIMGGLAFLTVTLNNKAQWWGLIPGLALIGIGGEIILGGINATWAHHLGGASVLGMLGLAFWLIYLMNRVQWWAIIPGGVLVTLAGVAIISDMTGGMESGSVFMFGLAATFALLALLTAKNPQPNTWAWIPAAILAVIGGMLFFSAFNLTGIVFSIALIGVGIYLAWRALKK